MPEYLSSRKSPFVTVIGVEAKRFDHHGGRDVGRRARWSLTLGSLLQVKPAFAAPTRRRAELEGTTDRHGRAPLDRVDSVPKVDKRADVRTLGRVIGDRRCRTGPCSTRRRIGDY